MLSSNIHAVVTYHVCVYRCLAESLESLADVFSDSDDQDDDGKKLLRYHCLMTGIFAVGMKLLESSFEKADEELESSADEEILRYIIPH